MKVFYPMLMGLVVRFSLVAFAAEPGTIGTAEMKADETIVLRLRAELPGGGSGEGRWSILRVILSTTKSWNTSVPSRRARLCSFVPGQTGETVTCDE